LTVRRQCALLGLSRSSLYYEPVPETPENLRLMRLIDEEYTAHPFLGSRRLARWLSAQGEAVNRKRVQRLMRLMGLEAIHPKPKLSAAGRGHRIYPYLLRQVRIERPDQVWSTDITYVPLARGFMYLAAIIDWYSRYVLAWRLSNTLDGSFCLDMLEEALSRGKPEVFNTDQGVQFTAQAWTSRLETAGVAVSMDGRGRCLDNVFVERLWRSVKYEDIYIHRYEAVPQLQQGLGRYFPCRSCSKAWGGISRTTTRNASISHWPIARQRRCIGKGAASGGRDDHRRDLHPPTAARPQRSAGQAAVGGRRSCWRSRSEV